MKDTLWGIDLGGTKIEGIVLRSAADDLSSYEILTRTRIDTEQEGGYEHILSRIAHLLDLLKAETGLTPETLGIGTPGTTEPATGLLKNSNTVCLLQRPLHTDLEKLLEIDCILANDANCFAFAESVFGSAINKNSVFGVIMGTGVGGGIIVNGAPLGGLQGIAGEWGHMVVEPEDGRECYCGCRGCLETVISGPSLQSFYRSQSTQDASLPEIVEKARTGTDVNATLTMERLYKYFGRGLATVIDILDPDIVVLGGGLSNIDELYTRGVEAVAQYVFNAELKTPIVRNSMGDSAGVFGAALLGRRQ